MYLLPFFQGMGIGGGLIIAIGAQNAFVLSQGIRRNHHLSIPFVCSLCDSALIFAGVAGMGTLVATNPTLAAIATWGGVAFLLWYGLRALRRVFSAGILEGGNDFNGSLKKTLIATLAVSLLNPHVYLDTVVLLGGISSRFTGTDRYLFGIGAMVASTLWFFCLSLGGQMLSPLFRKPIAWRVLDGIICLTLWGIATTLVMHPPGA